ncbi:hypothetical protein KBP51_06325 [Lactiplantibacillus pentosus]|uniref:hypothetical protein n=1 Tax=Lactiplantibacillus pentosus TaxID=1589 RepID=UPI001330102A|nr:hypothetical protein [Lactiplantibacillus pentosus]MBQ0836083.1 hypothetical protein [Lactiplantibacillus pentosus]
MSYNVWLEAKFRNASKPVQLGPNYNISDDCSEMITASVGSAPVVWDGRLANELLPELSDGINLLIFHSDNYHKYELADGCCTVRGCRDFLIKFQALCKKYPYATVREE